MQNCVFVGAEDREEGALGVGGGVEPRAVLVGCCLIVGVRVGVRVGIMVWRGGWWIS